MVSGETGSMEPRLAPLSAPEDGHEYVPVEIGWNRVRNLSPQSEGFFVVLCGTAGRAPMPGPAAWEPPLLQQGFGRRRGSRLCLDKEERVFVGQKGGGEIGRRWHYGQHCGWFN